MVLKLSVTDINPHFYHNYLRLQMFNLMHLHVNLLLMITIIKLMIEKSR